MGKSKRFLDRDGQLAAVTISAAALWLVDSWRRGLSADVAMNDLAASVDKNARRVFDLTELDMQAPRGQA